MIYSRVRFLSIVGGLLIERLLVLRVARFSHVVGHVAVMATAHCDTQPHVIDVTLLLTESVRVVQLLSLTPFLALNFRELLMRLRSRVSITGMRTALHVQLHQALLVEVDRLRDRTVEVSQCQTIHDFAL